MVKLSVPPARLGVAPPAVRYPPKVAAPFYLSPEWRRLASSVKAERGYACEECGRDMRAAPRALHADHVIEVKDGGAALDRNNIMLRCQPCHNRKTAKVAARRT